MSAEDLSVISKKLTAVLALQAAAIPEDKRPASLELILNRAGLTYVEIGQVVGKTPEAAAKAAQRARDKE